MTTKTIYWFRQDLRLNDNPSLAAAIENGQVIPIYILDDENAGEFQMGGASRWWLHHSLESLQSSLNGNLRLYTGDPKRIIPELATLESAAAVYWNRCYEPWRIARDTEIKNKLKELGVEVKSFNGSLLWEPWEVLKKDGTPYKVFSPYYRKGCLNADPPRQPLPTPDNLAEKVVPRANQSKGLSDLNLLPTIRWDEQLEPHWTIGESGAQETLATFLGSGIGSIKKGETSRPKRMSRACPHTCTMGKSLPIKFGTRQSIR